MTDDVGKCSCGWLRPVIGLCDLAGGLPPSTIVPVYRCPQCGAPHVSVELCDEHAERVIRAFNAARGN